MGRKKGRLVRQSISLSPSIERGCHNPYKWRGEKEKEKKEERIGTLRNRFRSSEKCLSVPSLTAATVEKETDFCTLAKYVLHIRVGDNWRLLPLHRKANKERY